LKLLNYEIIKHYTQKCHQQDDGDLLETKAAILYLTRQTK